jgi:4-amino-4-deoxy-L-arabinose transferase-like glycosyltransferase
MANKRKRSGTRRAVAAHALAPAAKPLAKPEPAVRGRSRAPIAVAPRDRRTAEALPDAAPADRGAAIGAGIVALVAFVVYALTVDHSLPGGDSGDLITSAYVLGVPHPPGYPLYTMLGYLATRLPGGSAAFWMNMLSALFDAVAVGLVFTIVHGSIAPRASTAANRRLSYAAAATGSLLLAFSSLFWAYSVVAEVFALNNLLAALLLVIALAWSRRPERIRLLWGFMFVLGLALCNQQTIVLLVPAFAVLAWRGGAALARARAVPRARDLALGLVALAAGLLPYLYLPLAASAHPVMNWGDPSSFHRFGADVLRKSYGTTSLTAGGEPGAVGHNLSLLFSSLANGFVYVGLALAVAGLWWAWKNRRAEGVAIVIAFLVSGPAFMAYTRTGFPDALAEGIVARFYVLPSIPLAVMAGLGAWWLIERASSLRLPAARPGLAGIAAATALLIVPGAAAVDHYSSEDRSGDSVALAYAEDLLGPLPTDSLLIMRGDENETSVTYAQNVDHFRPDVIAVDSELLKLSTYVDQVRRAHPGLLIPFTAYDGGETTSLNTFVQDNIPNRPVYYVGVQQEKKFGKPFDFIAGGLARRLVAKGSVKDPYAFLAANADRFASLRYPTGSYPASSWETQIAGDYAVAAFDVGYALETDGASAQIPLAEKMFRTAIRLDPSYGEPYKDLGAILNDHGGDPGEIIAAWTAYLRLAPGDPQDAEIRRALESVEARESAR